MKYGTNSQIGINLIDILILINDGNHLPTKYDVTIYLEGWSVQTNEFEISRCPYVGSMIYDKVEGWGRPQDGVLRVLQVDCLSVLHV